MDVGTCRHGQAVVYGIDVLDAQAVKNYWCPRCGAIRSEHPSWQDRPWISPYLQASVRSRRVVVFCAGFLFGAAFVLGMLRTGLG